MHSYSRLYFICPYYQGDNRDGGVTCECGRLKFKSTKYARIYFSQYCANNPGWEQCSLAQHMTKKLLEEDDDKKGT